jgi:integrase
MATVRKYRDRWVADFRDQNGRRRIEAPRGAFETMALEKRAAKELLDRRLGEVKAHSYTPDRQRLTFADLAKQWLASKVKIRHATLSDYRTMLDCYLVPYFGPRKIETIGRLDIERFRADMSGETLPATIVAARDAKRLELQSTDPSARLKPLEPGARTTNKCLGILVSLFGYARQHELVTRNPAEKIEKLPAEEGESRVIEENVLTPGELVRTIDRTVDPFRIPIALAAYCGLRQAEALGLKWSDIDWNRGTAEIRRSQRCGRFDDTKSKASRRTIELPPVLLAELKRWRLRVQNAEGNPHDLVCPSVRGKPMHGSALLTRGLYPALRRAGIRQVRFHDLRHSFASNLLGAGVDIVTVSKALGHANVHITLTTYAHAVPKARHGASDRMAALMGQSGNNLETGRSEIAAAGLSPASQVVDLAERVGFEPTYTGEDVTGIPVQRLRPLGHLSGASTQIRARRLQARSPSGKPDARCLDRRHDLGVELLRQRHQRQADAVLNQSKTGHRPLDGNRIRFEEHRPVQPLHLRVELARQLAVAGEGSIDDVADLPRRDVGAHRHDALVAGQHAFARQVVIAAQQRQPPADAREQLAIALQRARLLDADDVRQRHGQPLDSLRLQVAAGAARHVVQNDRNRDALGDRLVVLEQPFLCRPVVIRGHHQACVGAHILGELRRLDGVPRAVRAGTGDHGDPLGSALYHCAHDADVLLEVQRRRFAGRADRDEGAGAVGDVEFDQPAEGLVIDRAVRLHGRDERHDTAAEHGNPWVPGSRGSYWPGAARCKARTAEIGLAGTFSPRSRACRLAPPLSLSSFPTRCNLSSSALSAAIGPASSTISPASCSTATATSSTAA